MSHQSGFQPGIVFENKACLATADNGLPGCPVGKEAADLSLGKAISQFSQPPRVIISWHFLRRHLDKNSRGQFTRQAELLQVRLGKFVPSAAGCGDDDDGRMTHRCRSRQCRHDRGVKPSLYFMSGLSVRLAM
jgi:hypothetical protein